MEIEKSAATSEQGDRTLKLTQQQQITRFSQLRQDRVSAIKATFTLRQIIAECGYVVPAKDGVKFTSPLRPDRNPSCTIKGEHMTDWSSGRKPYDLIDFYAEHTGVSIKQAIAELYARAAGHHAMNHLHDRVFRSAVTVEEALNPPVTPDDEMEESKRRKRKVWASELRAPTKIELDVLALIRNLSREAVDYANHTGLLFSMGSGDLSAWVLANDSGTNAQARLYSGKPWQSFSGGCKAKTLPGSCASDPIYGTLKDHQSLALVEGGPDWLSVWHYALAEGIENRVMPVAMLGSGMKIPHYHLTQFAGRRVRIFVHDDASGNRAALRWSEQLDSVGCLVDGFSFGGLVRSDGRPVKDLNDCCSLSADSWETNRDLISNMMSFAVEDI